MTSLIEEAGALVYNSRVIEIEDRENVLDQMLNVLVVTGVATVSEIRGFYEKYQMNLKESTVASVGTVFHPNGEKVVLTIYKQPMGENKDYYGEIMIQEGGSLQLKKYYFKKENIASGIDEVVDEIPFLTRKELHFLGDMIVDLQIRVNGIDLNRQGGNLC